MSTWTQSEAVQLCVAIEAISPRFGYHVALTGGCLYKIGDRKDLDLIFYRVREHKTEGWRRCGMGTARPEMIKVLCDTLGLKIVDSWGPWKKIVMLGEKSIDMLFPDEEK